MIDDFDLFLFDMDGTLVLGDTALPGALECVAAMRHAKKPVYFVTNNTMHPAIEHVQRLHKAGFQAEVDEILTPLAGLIDYLRAHGIKNPFMVASDTVKNAVLCDPSLPHDAVILGLCRNWDYAQLQMAVNLSDAGAPVILCQPDPYCPDPKGPIPDSGALLALMETALCRALNPVIIGKPSPVMLAPVFARHQDIVRARTVMIGDRLHTDMKLADNAGIKGMLVLTGHTIAADVPQGCQYKVRETL